MPATPVAHPTLTTAPVVAAQPLGPATQALADKQAAKKAILVETTAKLKAVDTAEVAPAPKAAPKPRAKAMAAAVTAEPVAAKPRAPRKIKKADEV